MSDDSQKTPEQVEALVNALWYVLDDMGLNQKSCCGASKALARVAIEPWLTPEDDFDYTLEMAQQVLKECDLL